MGDSGWPEGADPTASYRCWTLPVDEEQAVKSFRRAYGRPPEYVAEVGGFLRVGPVPEKTDIIEHTDDEVEVKQLVLSKRVVELQATVERLILLKTGGHTKTEAVRFLSALKAPQLARAAELVSWRDTNSLAQEDGG